MAWSVDYLDAWNSHDGERIASFMTPDASYTDIVLAQTHRGRADIAAWINSMNREFSTDYRFEPGHELVSDSGYFLEWTLKGTHDGSTPRLPASQKQFAIHGVSVGELENGKIKRNTDYWNMVEFLVQIGAMPAPTAAGTP